MATLTGSPTATIEKHLRGRFDWWLLLSSFALLTVGLMSLHSLDVASHTQFFPKQLIRVFVGLGPFLVFLAVKPKFWQRYAHVLYAVNLGLLATVLFIGRASKGATRWIDLGPFDFQPSELAKLLIVITLASFFVSRADKLKSFSTFALSLLHVIVPAILVYKQPHLGATLVLMVTWLTISLVAGVPMKYILAVFVAGTCFLGLGIAFPRLGLISQYQLDRWIGFFSGNEQADGWQTMRAQLAYAVGGVSGTGYGQGEQKLSVPESENDFIAVVIGEEGGLIGCTLLLLAFGVFFFRIWHTMFQSEDLYYRLIIAGIFAVLAFHTIVNLGMNLKLMPVIGLWLPFLSAGGTALWLCMASVGLILNVRSRENPTRFGSDL